MSFRTLKRLLTWWDSQTLGTQLFTYFKGKKVGVDSEGNSYFENADGSRRWVIYDGDMEASRVSPEWHGWLHHTFDHPPTVKPFVRNSWETPHQKNMTGSISAYFPDGSLRASNTVSRKDYSPWIPNNQRDAKQSDD